MGHYRVVHIGHRAGGAFPALMSLPPGSGPEQTTQPPAANEAPNPPGPARAAAPPPTWGYLFTNERPRPDPLTPAGLSRRLDGVLWPRQTTGCAETGSPEFPVVLLEVQMHPDSGFQHRLAAQTYRFLQRHPQVEHLEVVVITPHQRHKLGPAQLPRHLRVFLGEVHWISLEALSQPPPASRSSPAALIWTRLCCLCWLNGFLTSVRSKSW